MRISIQISRMLLNEIPLNISRLPHVMRALQAVTLKTINLLKNKYILFNDYLKYWDYVVIHQRKVELTQLLYLHS